MVSDKVKKDVVGRVDPVDMIIAQRLYKRRCILGYSQKNLADYTGVSIQQIQKYEKSTNRISGGRLYRFAKFLEVSITYFFDNIEQELSASVAREDQADFSMPAVTEKEVLTLVRFYNEIRDRGVRKKFIDLIRAVSSINYIG